MADIHMYLFSRDRIGRQKTLQYLPDSLKKEHLTFVTPQNEVASHKQHDYGKKLDYLAVKDDMQLGDKRLRVVKHAAKEGFKKFLFLDDDLQLSYYDPDHNNFRSTRVFPNQALVAKTLLQHPSKILNTSEGMSFGCLTMTAKQDVQERGILQTFDKKSACFFGYQTEFLLQFADHPRFKTFWGIDTTWNLEVLNHGGHLCTDYRISWQTEFDQTINGGGSTSHRKLDSVNHSFLRMMLLHPGLITRGRTRVHIHSFLKISWKTAATPEKSRLALGWELFQQELTHQNTTESAFLAALPEVSRPYYTARIKELKSSSPSALF